MRRLRRWPCLPKSAACAKMPFLLGRQCSKPSHALLSQVPLLPKTPLHLASKSPSLRRMDHQGRQAGRDNIHAVYQATYLCMPCTFTLKNAHVVTGHPSLSFSVYLTKCLEETDGENGRQPQPSSSPAFQVAGRFLGCSRGISL